MRKLPPLGFVLKNPTEAQRANHEQALVMIGEQVAPKVFASVAKITTENRKVQSTALALQLAYLLNPVPAAMVSSKEKRDAICQRLIDAAIGIQVVNPEEPPTAWELLAHAGHDLGVLGGASLYGMSTSFVRVRRARGPKSAIYTAIEIGHWGQCASRWTDWVAAGKPDLLAGGRPPNMIFNRETMKIEHEVPTLDGPWCTVHDRIMKTYGDEYGIDSRGRNAWVRVLDYIAEVENLAHIHNEAWTNRRSR